MRDTLPVPGSPDILVRLRRSTRAKRLSLRVGRTDGAVTLSLPRFVGEGEAERFVALQADWIRAQVARAPAPTVAGLGGSVLLEGAEVPIVAGTGRAARVTGEAITLPGAPQSHGTRLKALLKNLARQRILPACDHYAEKLGRPFGKVTLRDTRSRWGSCTARGDLMFSWRLIMAPPEILEYVVAHEVAHLAHMDHSPQFWAQVEALMPGHKPHRKWLREHGARLQAVRFDATEANVDP